jgi:hypothetical protein
VNKRHSPLRPFAELGVNVFGEESDGPRTAYEGVLFGAGLGGDDGKNGVAVGRGNREPSSAGLNDKVKRNTETELVYVKAKAGVLITNIDGGAVQTEIGTFWIEANDGTGRAILRVIGRGIERGVGRARAFHRAIIGGLTRRKGEVSFEISPLALRFFESVGTQEYDSSALLPLPDL